jgi:hypothetical protein
MGKQQPKRDELFHTVGLQKLLAATCCVTEPERSAVYSQATREGGLSILLAERGTSERGLHTAREQHDDC